MEKKYSSIEELISANLKEDEYEKTAEIIKDHSGVKDRGYCLKQEFIDICTWKSHRPQHWPIKNSEEDIKEITKEAFSSTSEKRRIDLLTTLKGVALPTASAILTITDPLNYGVIDIRVLEILRLYGLVENTRMNFNNWDICLGELRYYAKKFKVSARDVERTIFNHHREIQDGTLYK